VTRNLNRIIDVNYYPVETARRSNMRHRPIGMGVQARLGTSRSDAARSLRASSLRSSPPVRERHSPAAFPVTQQALSRRQPC